MAEEAPHPPPTATDAPPTPPGGDTTAPPPPESGAKTPDAAVVAAPAPPSGTATPTAPDGTKSPVQDAAEMLRKVRQEDGIHYRLPDTPDDFIIPGSLTPETEIYIFGLFSPQMLTTELQFRETTKRDKVSLSVLMSPGRVSLGTVENKQHKEELGGEAPLTPSEAIVIRAKAYGNHMKITVNDKEFTFNEKPEHPLGKCKYFSLFGDVFIASVSMFKPVWPDHFYVSLASHVSAGYHFTVVGTVLPEADKCVVSVLATPENHDQTLIQLTASFDPEKKLVRNTKQEGVWLEEQVDPECPLEKGQPFNLDVYIGETDFSMSINEKPLPPYKHKVFYGLATCICIERNVQVKAIRICSISHPKHWNNKPPNVKQAHLLFYNQEVPACAPVTLQAGHCFYVQATPKPHGKTFKVLLSKGEGEAAEAGLVLEGNVAERKVYVYDGSADAKGAGHPADIAANRLFSCRVDVLADAYKVWVNTLATNTNVDPYEVKHRVPTAEVTHLGVYGQVKKINALTAVEEA